MYSSNSDSLASWYQKHLGFSLQRLVADDQSISCYQELYYRDLDGNRLNMKIVTRVIIGLHMYVGLGALLGGISAVLNPEKPLGISTDMHANSPFTNNLQSIFACMVLYTNDEFPVSIAREFISNTLRRNPMKKPESQHEKP